MEIVSIIQKKKEFYPFLMEYIDSTEKADIESLIKGFEDQKDFKSKDEMITILQLLSKIADNHYRLPDFFDKLEKIIQYLIKELDSEISDFDIYQIFKSNKRVLLLLLERGFIQPTKEIINNIIRTKDKNKFPYSHYLYSAIKSSITKKRRNKIESEIKEKYDDDIENFVKKCHTGENDSYICSLIRQDSVEEFISYISRTNTSLTIQIQPSIFETNSFLIEKVPTLIEYASFFGSIQIIQYLKYNKVPLTNSMWLYVVHSNNAELIHFLEENEVNKKVDFDEILKESIACHHNEIADYIKDNFLDKKQIDCFGRCITDCHNYYYYTTDIERVISEPRHENGFCISELCFLLKHITIPSSVTSIGINAFEGCSSLTQITIPSSVTSIGESAFRECSSLTQIAIPSSVTSIENSTFVSCSSLTQVTIPSSVTKIGNDAFNGCSSLSKIEIPSSVKSIGKGAFRACSMLKQIKIPSSVNKIDECTFDNCLKLEHIEIPSSVTNIGNYAFSCCPRLERIEIPSSVTEIGNEAFYECKALAQISIPSSINIKLLNIPEKTKIIVI